MAFVGYFAGCFYSRCPPRSLQRKRKETVSWAVKVCAEQPMGLLWAPDFFYPGQSCCYFLKFVFLFVPFSISFINQLSTMGLGLCRMCFLGLKFPSRAWFAHKQCQSYADVSWWSMANLSISCQLLSSTVISILVTRRLYPTDRELLIKWSCLWTHFLPCYPSLKNKNQENVKYPQFRILSVSCVTAVAYL